MPSEFVWLGSHFLRAMRRRQRATVKSAQAAQVLPHPLSSNEQIRRGAAGGGGTHVVPALSPSDLQPLTVHSVTAEDEHAVAFLQGHTRDHTVCVIGALHTGPAAISAGALCTTIMEGRAAVRGSSSVVHVRQLTCRGVVPARFTCPNICPGCPPPPPPPPCPVIL